MIGKRLLHYEILERLGEGGMGVVYKARDTHLERLVAIKILPPDKTADAERKRRFVQEARAASALNHPNIVTIHDIASDGGIDFMVMEHVAGQGLDQLIPRGLTPDQVLRYAVQIASALAKAHSAGIVHRDLKPANIMIDLDDRVKVLDFGLAKLTPMTLGPSDETLMVSAQTQAGMVVGTAYYMSPEQAEGKPVDGRSDIFTFGAVLYEMITGHRAFEHETSISTIAAILRDEPRPISAIKTRVPQDLERVVARCLRKDPDRRYLAMNELRIALEDLKQESDSGKLATAEPTTAGNSKQKWRMALTAAGIPVIVSAVLALAWLVAKKDVVRPPPAVKRLTFDSGLALHPAVSPDGKYLAFASDRAGEGNLDIWVQDLPGGEPVRLTRDPADEDFPSFSPDGTKIAFQSERALRGIYSIPILGGEPRLLAQHGIRPRYSPDGQRLSFTDPGSGRQTLTTAVFLMPAEGGERTEFRTGFDISSNPVWSPDARRLLYAGVSGLHSDSKGFQLDDAVSGSSAWYIASVSGGQPVRVDPSTHFARFLQAFPLPLAWLKNNRILFSYASGDAVNLWLAKLSPDNRRIIGPPEQLTFGTGRITDAAVADSGTAVFTIAATRPRLWDIPLETRTTRDKGNPMAVVTNRDFTYWPSLSDTEKLAYVAKRSDKFNLWLRDLPSGKETLLANLEGDINVVSAYVNRAGTQVAYTTLLDSKPTIYTIGAGGGTPEKICADCGQLRSWSPEHKVMLSQEPGREGTSRINRIDAVTGRKTVLLEKNLLYAPDVSPDGRWVAFQARLALSDRREQLFLAPMSDGGAVEPERWVPITELKYFDANPLFSRDGKIVYFNSDRDGFTCLWAVRLDPAAGKPVGDAYPVKHFHGSPRHYSWYPAFGVGRDRIIISLEQLQSDLWTLQLPALE